MSDVPSGLNEVEDAIASYYGQSIAKHGPTPQGVDWRDEASQRLRFDRLLAIVGPEERTASLLDLGCGYGAMAPFARQLGLLGPYVGYDIVPAMIDSARQLHGGLAEVDFRVGGRPVATADYAVASGLLNVRLDYDADLWVRQIISVLDTLAAASRRGFAFNALSSYSDIERRADHLYYASPEEMFALCAQRYSRHVAILHDYGLYEFTVHVRFS